MKAENQKPPPNHRAHRERHWCIKEKHNIGFNSVLSLKALSHPFASVMRFMDAYLLSATVGCGLSFLMENRRKGGSGIERVYFIFLDKAQNAMIFNHIFFLE